MSCLLNIMLDLFYLIRPKKSLRGSGFTNYLHWLPGNLAVTTGLQEVTPSLIHSTITLM